jgi:hypothetical protein
MDMLSCIQCEHVRDSPLDEGRQKGTAGCEESMRGTYHRNDRRVVTWDNVPQHVCNTGSVYTSTSLTSSR